MEWCTKDEELLGKLKSGSLAEFILYGQPVPHKVQTHLSHSLIVALKHYDQTK